MGEGWRGGPGTENFECDTGRSHFPAPGPDHPFRPRHNSETQCAFRDLAETKDYQGGCDLDRNQHQYVLQPKIEIEVWKPNPDEQYPGTLILDYRRKIQDVLDELNFKLTAEGLEPDEHGFSNMTKYEDPKYMEEGPRKYSQYSLPWPEYRRIAVFPVTGGSEGHYVHLGIIEPNTHGLERQTYRTIGLAKTFRGWDHACRISAAAARLLQA
jgi:hypothetical protein